MLYIYKCIVKNTLKIRIRDKSDQKLNPLLYFIHNSFYRLICRVENYDC